MSNTLLVSCVLGDLHAGIDDAVFSIDPLLEWAERDEREGAKDPGGLNDS